MASSTITSPTYDPITTATSLATGATAALKKSLAAQVTANASNTTALTKLQSAMTTFEAAMTAMSKAKTVISQTATLSNTAYGTATADATAAPGTYSFFIDQLATAAQTSYTMPASSTAGGSLTVAIGSSSFVVDLSPTATGSATLTPQQIATAINSNSANNGDVTAAVVTINGVAQMVLSSNVTGAANTISLTANGSVDPALSVAVANATQVVVPQDATVHLGGASGTAITQASNTFTNIGGVSVTFTQAMATGATPVTLKVAADDSGTAANVQTFVDAFNTLKGVIDDLTSPGDAANGVAASIFAHDSGLNALKANLNAALRTTVGGVSLTQYGITATREGTLELDTTKLASKLAADPKALDTLFGNNTLGTSSGVLGNIDKYLDTWNNGADGQLTRRLDANATASDALTARQDRLTTQYNSLYAKYLAQFTQLQVLQEEMSKTVDMFSALFSDSSS